MRGIDGEAMLQLSEERAARVEGGSESRRAESRVEAAVK